MKPKSSRSIRELFRFSSFQTWCLFKRGAKGEGKFIYQQCTIENFWRRKKRHHIKWSQNQDTGHKVAYWKITKTAEVYLENSQISMMESFPKMVRLLVLNPLMPGGNKKVTHT